MQGLTRVLGLMLISSMCAFAQNSVTTGGNGTPAGTVPVFMGTPYGTAADIENSNIIQTSSYISASLPVQITNTGQLDPTLVGSTLSQLDMFNVDGGNLTDLAIFQRRNALGTGWPNATTRIQQWIDDVDMGYIDFNPANGGGWGLAFGSGDGSEFMRISGSGNVGIGTPSPGAKLEVNGNILLTQGSGSSITFPNGSVQYVAWNGVLNGGDYAESVDVAGNRSSYEPGDVLMLDPESNSDVVKAAEPYSTLVSGIYATKPGALGRRKTLDLKASTTEIPMAMVGIVPTKVSAENGPISKGDLLVSSSTPGYAMKGTDRNRMLGAVLGKAMESMSSGTGVIQVLVTLQ